MAMVEEGLAKEKRRAPCRCFRPTAWLHRSPLFAVAAVVSVAAARNLSCQTVTGQKLPPLSSCHGVVPAVLVLWTALFEPLAATLRAAAVKNEPLVT